MSEDTIEEKTACVVHEIQVHINEQAVALISRRNSGLEIKQAAIDQGVEIGLDFVLSIERGPNNTKIIGDDDLVTVTKNSRFLAIPDDDNS